MDAERENTTEVTGCSVSAAGGAWTNQGFLAQRQRLVAEFTAMPSHGAIDAVVGFSDGAASRFTQLAAIVRFNPSGFIDVRAGSTYRADASVRYTSGTRYQFRLEIDVTARVYSVRVASSDDSPTWLARQFPFRTEQAQVTQLSNVAIKVDSSTGVLQVCDLQITAINGMGCPVAQAGNGFIHESIGQPGDVVVSWSFMATPDSILDGVIGLSQTRAARFSDLSAAVRFAPSGIIDARNGGAYRADVAVPYSAGTSYEFRIIANLPTRTYSVYVMGAGVPAVRLAHSYAFRSDAPSGFITELAAIIDSPGGEISVCDRFHGVSIGTRFLREGNYAIAALPGGDALVSDGATTLHLDPAGRVMNTVPRGGHIAVDPAGNVYLASLSGAALVIEAYTPGLVLRWTRSYLAGDGKRVLAIGADTASVVAATGPVGGGVDLVKRWLADGTESITRSGPMADVIAIGPAGLALGSETNGTVVVTRWPLGPSPAPEWQRSWQNSAQINAIAIAPDGSVSFGGAFFAPINFGGPSLEPRPGVDRPDTYLAALTATGGHQFSRTLGPGEVFSIASTGGTTAVSTPLRAMLLTNDGHEIRGEFGRNPVPGSGVPGQIAIGPGRVYWNYAVTPLSSPPSYPYLLVYDPGV